MYGEPWMKKRKANGPPAMDDESEDAPISIPFMFPKMTGGTSVYSTNNHVYFNDEINNDSVFALTRELQSVANKLKLLAYTHGMEPGPIYLHLTTDGGSIHSAFSVVDTINALPVPVHTIVDGFVASAGTLISLAGKKRYIMPNAYMLIHELRSGVWGKMSSIEEEVENLKKVMDHIYKFYQTHTQLTKKQLEGILSKDIIWNASECISKGVVDDIFTA